MHSLGGSGTIHSELRRRRLGSSSGMGSAIIADRKAARLNEDKRASWRGDGRHWADAAYAFVFGL